MFKCHPGNLRHETLQGDVTGSESTKVRKTFVGRGFSEKRARKFFPKSEEGAELRTGNCGQKGSREKKRSLAERSGAHRLENFNKHVKSRNKDVDGARTGTKHSKKTHQEKARPARILKGATNLQGPAQPGPQRGFN